MILGTQLAYAMKTGVHGHLAGLPNDVLWNIAGMWILYGFILMNALKKYLSIFKNNPKLPSFTVWVGFWVIFFYF